MARKKVSGLNLQGGLIMNERVINTEDAIFGYVDDVILFLKDQCHDAIASLDSDDIDYMNGITLPLLKKLTSRDFNYNDFLQIEFSPMGGAIIYKLERSKVSAV